MKPRKTKTDGNEKPAEDADRDDTSTAKAFEEAVASQEQGSTDPEQSEETDTPAGEDQAAELESEVAGAGSLTEAPEGSVKRLESELTDLQDRHLRIVAEYENFRKRTARERAQLWSRAQAEVVSSILDGLDDFGRVLDVDTSKAKVEDVVKGVELVERKLVRELEELGLERVGGVGEPFDPNHHEAIGSLPADSEEQDHTVGSVLQLGYKFGGVLIRPAKVQVLMWQDTQNEESS